MTGGEGSVGTLRKRVKNLLESLTGCDIERFGGKSFALIDKKRRTEVWFSYRAQLTWIIERFGIDLVIDVGANEGQFARNLRRFYSGEIISFEPVSSAFEKLTAIASADPHWHVHKLALGSQEGTGIINVSRETKFSSLLKANDYCVRRFGDGTVGTREEAVSIYTLDKLLDEVALDVEGKHLFVKMDTQGYDTEVFKGLGNKLQHVAALQSEVSLIPVYENMPHWTESIAVYERAGFGVVGMFPVVWDSGRVIEYDCLLTRVGL